MAFTSPNAFYADCVLRAHGAPEAGRWGDPGCLPLVRMPYGARAWRSPYTFLTAPRFDGDDAVSAWRSLLGPQRTPPGLLRLELLPAEPDALEPFVQACEDLGLAFAPARRFERAVLDAQTDRETLEARWSRQRRKAVRKARAGLEELGDVSFDRADDPADVAAAYADFCALERSGWKGRAGTSLAQHPRDREAFGAALEGLAAGRGARIHVLRLDGRPIAVAIVLRDPPHAYAAKIAYDEALSRFSPGVVLGVAMTGALIDDPEIRLVDSCATWGNDMIAWMWPDRRPLVDMVVATRRYVPRGLVASSARAMGLAFAARERLKRAVGRAPGRRA